MLSKFLNSKFLNNFKENIFYTENFILIGSGFAFKKKY